jgi:hypothetical protein
MGYEVQALLYLARSNQRNRFIRYGPHGHHVEKLDVGLPVIASGATFRDLPYWRKLFFRRQTTNLRIHPEAL